MAWNDGIAWTAFEWTRKSDFLLLVFSGLSGVIFEITSLVLLGNCHSSETEDELENVCTLRSTNNSQETEPKFVQRSFRAVAGIVW